MRSNLKILFFLLLLIIPKNGFSSPQAPDYIIYKGDTIPIYNLILEAYLSKIKQPDQGSLFGLKFRDGASLNCWRGYQAIYKIESDSLFLCNILSCQELYYHKTINLAESNNRIRELFYGKVINGRVFIDWFSGNINIPKRNVLRWDGVFYKTYENEILIYIKRGIIKRVKAIANYIDFPDRLNRRYNDTISRTLFEKLKDLDWKELDKCDCADHYIITINKKGKISDVKFVDYPTRKEIKEYWDRKDYILCIKSVYNALKSLRFDIIKQNEEKVSEKVYLDLWYNDESGQIENWTNGPL